MSWERVAAIGLGAFAAVVGAFTLLDVAHGEPPPIVTEPPPTTTEPPPSGTAPEPS